jgi:hypothetical protein
MHISMTWIRATNSSENPHNGTLPAGYGLGSPLEPGGVLPIHPSTNENDRYYIVATAIEVDEFGTMGVIMYVLQLRATVEEAGPSYRWRLHWSNFQAQTWDDGIVSGYGNFSSNSAQPGQAGNVPADNSVSESWALGESILRTGTAGGMGHITDGWEVAYQGGD